MRGGLQGVLIGKLGGNERRTGWEGGWKSKARSKVMRGDEIEIVSEGKSNLEYIDVQERCLKTLLRSSHREVSTLPNFVTFN